MQEFNFGNNLKAIRKSNGMTQKQVVDILGCSKNKYASWEQGRTQPDITSIRQLCYIFGVSADELFDIDVHDANFKKEFEYLDHKH